MAASRPPRRRVERVVVLSLSSSIGMSHYARALARSLMPHIAVVLIDRATEKEGPPTILRRVRGLLRDNDTSVIATSPHWMLPVILGWSHAQGAHVMHGPLIYMASRLTRPVYVAYYRALTRQLPVVIVHADRFVEAVRALRLPAAHVLVVPHGFVPESLVRGGAYDPGGPLVCVGRLLPYKGMDVFVRALEILAHRGSPVAATIAGEGVTQDLAPGGLDGLEIVSGRVSDATLAAMIDRCSAVVLPYRKATQSGVLAHAFAAGRPVIATDVGAFPEYVDNTNGLLVPPGDASALADAIQRLRADRSRSQRLAKGARRTWEERLDPDVAARRILEAIGA